MSKSSQYSHFLNVFYVIKLEHGFPMYLHLKSVWLWTPGDFLGCSSFNNDGAKGFLMTALYLELFLNILFTLFTKIASEYNHYLIIKCNLIQHYKLRPQDCPQLNQHISITVLTIKMTLKDGIYHWFLSWDWCIGLHQSVQSFYILLKNHSTIKAM